MPRDLLVFDMDGVLVDVTQSYRATIQETVRHFAGISVSPEQIQDYKNQGGWNDDFALSHRMIEDVGARVAYNAVVAYFQRIFHGANEDGKILQEKWVACEGLFDRLFAHYSLSVFTGRYQWEAILTLKRFAPSMFCPVVGSDNVERAKPAPDGLIKILEEVPHDRAWYIGDTVDDARASSAARVPFIGIAAPGSSRYEELRVLLASEGAIAVLDSINQLESVIE